jgi:hypothetical protein
VLKTVVISLPTSLLTIALVAGCAGCKVRQPPTPQYTCPQAQLGPNNTVRNYTTLNLSAPAPVTAYTDLNSPTNQIVPGTWCYIAQAFQNGRKSPPSNIALVTVAPGKHKVVLSWKAPANCTRCTYILGRTAAIAIPPTAPTTGSRNVSAAQVK